MEIINGYILISDFTNENSGLSRWAFCKKDDREYFIKEYLDVKYPSADSGLSVNNIRRKRKLCEDFYAKKLEFFTVLKKCRTGNNMIILDFFRSGARYYSVTEKVAGFVATPQYMESLGFSQKLTLTREILYSISSLHRAGIVHADIKPENVLLKETTDGFVTGKIIDFDSGFIIGHQPDKVEGDPVYFAPESFLRLQGEKTVLTEKIDIFALGVMLHLFWAGKLPQFRNVYEATYDGVLNGEPIRRCAEVPPAIFKALYAMMAKEPERRPSASNVLRYLDTVQKNGLNPAPGTGRLKRSADPFAWDEKNEFEGIE